MSLNEYELVIIVRPDLDDATTKGLLEKVENVITKNGGHILLRDDWGQRKLAYAIDDHQKGHYFIIHNLAKPETIAEAERVIRITDGLIRFLFVRVAEAVDVETRIAEAAEQARLRAQEAAARAKAEAEAEADAEDEDDDEDEEEEDTDHEAEASA